MVGGVQFVTSVFQLAAVIPDVVSSFLTDGLYIFDLLMEIAAGERQGRIPVVVKADFCIRERSAFKSGDETIGLLFAKAASYRRGLRVA